MTSDPLHDEINLIRLVRRLDTTNSQVLEQENSPQKWIKAQGTLQKVRYARSLLKNVQLFEDDQPPERVQQLNDVKIKLDKMELRLKGIEPPPQVRPPSILSHIPQPPSPSPLSLDLPPSSSDVTVASVDGESMAIPTDDLLLPADTPSYPSSTSFSFPTPMTLIPTSIQPGDKPIAIATGAATRSLQNSSAIQQELSDQLVQMAAQLKRNAAHFSESLAADSGLVNETKEKIEENYDVMQKERKRLRDHSGKSGSTTCLTVLIIVTVLLLFVVMVSLIRFT